MTTTSKPAAATDTLDAIVIGAGFAGLYMLYHLRELGYRARVLEMGDGVGGTWYWNRYPGARCDVQSIEYSYSFSPVIDEEWEWTELMPAQPEIERYLNFVADRLELRDGIQLETKVTSADWDEATSRWTVATDRGEQFVAPFVIAATGCLSAPLTPNIPGMDDFKGTKLFSNQFPKEGFDFSGKRVALVGTGSSGVQITPVVAEQAEHLYVFQRSAAFTRPANNRPLEPGELDALKKTYPEIRAKQETAFSGLIAFGALSVAAVPAERKILETDEEERLRILDELGWSAPMAWADVMVDEEANRAGTELYAELIRREVKDPEVAASLVPHYPMGCKRPIIDTGYFQTFNRDNVTLVDLRKGALQRITETGIETDQGHFDVDVILFATGFDAMTGALTRIDIHGRDGRLLKDYWDAEGPRTYLGLQMAGYPNLFTITGPGSPSVLANMVMGIEHHVRWIGSTMDHLRTHGLSAIEPTVEAQDDWVEHVRSIVDGSIRTAESCNSWYLGANIPGKPRVYMPYTGGLPMYKEKVADITNDDYRGFRFEGAAAGIATTR